MECMAGSPPLTRRRFLSRSALFAAMALSTSSWLEACGGSSAGNAGQQPVTLKFLHWIGTDAGPVVAEINKRFHQAYPNITVQFSSLPTDQYETVLKARLAGGDAPDIFGVFPGVKFYPYAKAHYLADLSSESWVKRLLPGVKRVISYTDGRIYALPLDQNVIGVVYNKQIFREYNLSVPTNWPDFLAVCEQLKRAGVTPLALGIKDQWVDQLIPYAMAPSAIYRNDPDFDKQMFAGRRTFFASPWRQMMRDYLDLNARGYFNQGALGTTYVQTTQMMAAGKAAMVVNGNWILAPIRQLNPKLDLGMFPLPYGEAGQSIWVSSAVGTTLAISSTTRYPAEARQYLQFWARPDIMALYLKEKVAYSSFLDISNPALDPAAQEMVAPLKVGSYNFLDQNWPLGVQDSMFKDIQAVFAGSMSIDQMLQDMDSVFLKNKGSIS
ncbi:ABC transporter substrate-binding protein [Thermogemmatispora carboxidivorans]|uniref:ABC transporter substrate-binding protein n=1 Tax=Thermogemmatispora carboxidivorans TaxID=1382306 RepID=UPI00069A2994|nr:extracellular solute-binding protein [Thermogemmatispora carboxidivorans]